MRTALSLTVFLIVGVSAQVVVIWLASVLFRIRSAGLRSALGTFGLQLMTYLAIALTAVALFLLIPNSAPRGVLLLFGVSYLIVSIVAWVVCTRHVLRCTWIQALGVYVGQSLAAGSCLAVLKAIALQAFVVPTNGMAPTVLGHHHVGACSACGGQAIVSASQAADGLHPEFDGGICSQCWTFREVQADWSVRYSGDRIVVSTLEQPRRWDLVTFHPNHEPGQIYLQRIVALPGEHILIRDGSIWIDGQKARLPSGLANLRYDVDPGFVPRQSDPAPSWQMGHDEYFLLGDNSNRSLDSRSFGPIPEGAIRGLAVAIYWPPRRARLLERQPSDSDK